MGECVHNNEDVKRGFWLRLNSLHVKKHHVREFFQMLRNKGLENWKDFLKIVECCRLFYKVSTF